MLVTDLVGSTSLARELGARWSGVLARHDEIVRGVCSRHGGQCSGATGDGLSFVFDGAEDAVAAAWGIVRGIEADAWPEDARVRVRVGVHLGAVVQTGDVFSGVTIHEAARVTALAGTSQVLVTDVARRLTRSLPTGTELVDLGLHVVRDFPEPVRLFRLDELGADSRAAPARDAHRAELAPIVGRDDVIDRLRGELSSGRLVTIVGPGGMGKTRLAVELMRTHPGDVVMADLAEIERDDEVDPLLIDLFRVGGSGPHGGLGRAGRVEGGAGGVGQLRARRRWGERGV